MTHLSLCQDIADIVDTYTQSERCHRDTKGYVKLTAKQIKSDLIAKMSYFAQSFCLGTVNNILNRLGYSLKKVRKTLPFKRIEATDTIFENITTHRNTKSSGVLKLSIDVKDKIKVGELSREGYHRNQQDVKALDKDQHWDSKLVPLGILEIETGQVTVIMGNSNETSDFIVDGLEIWFELNKERLKHFHTLELYSDNGPAVQSMRTQFINRIMEFACITGLNIHLLYYPPYHSKYNPVERVWARIENYWSGTILNTVTKVVDTIENITWKGLKMTSVLLDKVYEKAITLTKKQMNEREVLIQRSTQIPKWDVWIRPSLEMGMLFIG